MGTARKLKHQIQGGRLFEALLTSLVDTRAKFLLGWIEISEEDAETVLGRALQKPTFQPLLGFFFLREMGNKVEVVKKEPTLAPSTVVGRVLFHSFEHRTGRLLVAAIRKNSKEAIDEAVDFARKEFVKPHSSGVSNDKNFEEMTAGLISYLTQDTDIGDGSLFTQTPLRFAKGLKADIAVKAIEEHITRLRRKQNPVCENIRQASVDVEADRSRADLAKERLKAFRASAGES